jgi:hypothetical protein
MIKSIIEFFLKLCGLYPSRITVSSNYGLLNELIGNFRVQKTYIKWKRHDISRIEALHNIHQDSKRCFIIGNGPSLNNTDLTMLKNEITFGSNAIYLNYSMMGYLPTYYAVVDNLVCEDRSNDINRLNDFDIKFFPLNMAYAINRHRNTIFLLQKRAEKYPSFSTDLAECIYGGYTVTYYHLQIAYYMGFKNVYLIGMDHDYPMPNNYEITYRNGGSPEITFLEDDKAHFNQNYFGKGYRMHDPRYALPKMEMAYQKAFEVFSADNRNIFNATIGGKLDIYPRIDYNNLFK